MPKHGREKVTWLAGPLNAAGIYRRVERSLSPLQKDRTNSTADLNFQKAPHRKERRVPPTFPSRVTA